MALSARRVLVLLAIIGLLAWTLMSFDSSDAVPSLQSVVPSSPLSLPSRATPTAETSVAVASSPRLAAAPAASHTRDYSALKAALEDPRKDLQAALRASFNLYDAQLTEPSVTPAWWGARNIQADIAAMDPMASVIDIRCIETMCGVDVAYQEIPEALDEKLLNQPSLQGGALIQRLEGDPKRMRIYIFASELEPARGEGLARPGEVKREG